MPWVLLSATPCDAQVGVARRSPHSHSRVAEMRVAHACVLLLAGAHFGEPRPPRAPFCRTCGGAPFALIKTLIKTLITPASSQRSRGARRLPRTSSRWVFRPRRLPPMRHCFHTQLTLPPTPRPVPVAQGARARLHVRRQLPHRGRRPRRLRRRVPVVRRRLPDQPSVLRPS